MALAKKFQHSRLALLLLYGSVQESGYRHQSVYWLSFRMRRDDTLVWMHFYACFTRITCLLDCPSKWYCFWLGLAYNFSCQNPAAGCKQNVNLKIHSLLTAIISKRRCDSILEKEIVVCH